MKHRIPDNLTVIAALIILTLLALALIGCGIPSYPYLYPPEALDPYANSVLTFTHDGNNDAGVFKGYEIYYRFYATDPNTLLGTSQAEIDMEEYFTTSYQISSIISESGTPAYNHGFRRAIVKGTPDNTPQLSITPPSQIENSFQVELVQLTDTSAPIELNLSYDDSLDYTLLRIVTKDGDYKSFFPRNDNYEEDDSDIVDEEIVVTFTENFFVAFFAVPYGTDPVSLSPLYANGSYEGMEYIGRFEIQ